jgi:hypothetical protein
MPCKSAAAVGVQRLRIRNKHPSDARGHLFLFDKFLAVGLGNAFPDGGAKAGVLLKPAARPHPIAGGFHLVTAGDSDIDRFVTALHDHFKVD